MNDLKYRSLKQSIISTFVIGGLAHLFAYGNLMVSNDSLAEFYASGRWPKAYLGRFFYSVYVSVAHGKIAVPWLIGFLSLLWCSLAVYLMVCIFKIRNQSILFLIAGICVTNPTVYALTATYIHDLDADLFAMLLAVFAVCLWDWASNNLNWRSSLKYFFIGSVVLSISLGLYQSYVSVAISLIIMKCIYEVLENNNFQNTLVKGLWGAMMLLLAAICYLAEVKVFQIITGISMLDNNSYNGLGNIQQIFDGNIFYRIVEDYRDFIDTFQNFLFSSELPKVMEGVMILLLLCICFFCVIGLKKIDWKSRCLVLLLLMVLPFGMNISFFLSNGMGHVLMKYAVWFVWVFVVILMQWFDENINMAESVKKGFQCIVIISLTLIIIENIYTSNAIYMKKEIEYQSTLSYMTAVADKMEEHKEYIVGETPVLFIGEYLGNSKDGFENYNKITGVGINGPITYRSSYEAYFEYVLGIPVIMSEEMSLENDIRVLEMPVFPKEGSIEKIDEVLVVKLK